LCQKGELHSRESFFLAGTFFFEVSLKEEEQETREEQIAVSIERLRDLMGIK
jgi:hypothetical protein